MLGTDKASLRLATRSSCWAVESSIQHETKAALNNSLDGERRRLPVLQEVRGVRGSHLERGL